MPDNPTSIGPITTESTGGAGTGSGSGTNTVPTTGGNGVGGSGGAIGQFSSEDRYAFFGSGQAPSFSQTMQEIGNLLQIDKSKYDFTNRSFPSDLTADYNQHIMVININVPVQQGNENAIRSFYTNPTGPTNVSITQTLTGGGTKLDDAKDGVGQGILGGVGSAAGSLSSQSPSSISQNMNNYSPLTGTTVPRFTKRIKESIALHMPTPLIFNHMNIYEEVSLTAFATQALKIGVAAGAAALSPIIGLLTPSASTAAYALGVTGSVLGATASAAGTIAKIRATPINPRIEILFAHTAQRVFDFELLLAPRNQKESEDAKRIIDTLRYHAAPEMDAIIGIPLLIPPAEFDITFFHGGAENTTIPRINTCVMERIEVDYSSTGGIYATFSNGHPVTIRVSMRFREIEIPHKTRILQGF
jgi:hypothetical protein